MQSACRGRILGAVAAVVGFTFAAIGPADAATVSAGALSEGVLLDLSGLPTCGATGALTTNVGVFTGSGRAGSGRSVCGDTTSIQVKDGTVPAPFGRFNPAGGAWIDSNDLSVVVWDVGIGARFTAVSFALIDAFDQTKSFFQIAVDGVPLWEIASRETDGELHWLTVVFDAAVESAQLTFRTRRNDGFGIAEARVLAAEVSPVPVPPAAVLLVPGLLALAGLGRRRRPAAA